MPVNYLGDGRVYGSTVYAGTGNTGSVDVSGEVASLSTLQVGTNFTGGAVPLAEGTVTLTGGTNLTFEYQGAGTPPGGFGVGALVGRSDGLGSANGLLIVEYGSTIAFNNSAEENVSGFLSGAYGNLNIGRGSGANGIVSVEGAGSMLTASGGAARITVGQDFGSGALEVSDGGLMGTFNLTVGRNASRGIVSVDGAGSEIKLGFGYGFYGSAYGGANGASSIGRQFNGQGILAIQDGGALRLENNDGVNDGGYLRLGRDEDSFGYAVVSGAGSELSLNQVGAVDQNTSGVIFMVGQGGRGIAAFEHDGLMRVTGEDASVTVANGRGGSQELLQSELILRSGADAVIDSREAGAPTASGSSVTVGNAAGLSGKLIVDGAGTTLSIQSDNIADDNGVDQIFYGATLVVGSEGNGRLEVTDGGTVTIQQNDDVFGGLVLGSSNGGGQAESYALVSGAGSSISIFGTNTTGTYGTSFGEAGSIAIGHRTDKTGTLVIMDGGSVSNSASNSVTQIGANVGGTGTVIVDGSTSSFAAGTLMAVGADVDFSTGTALTGAGGTGTLTLSYGGSASAGAIYVGDTGTLNLGGNLTGNTTVTGTLNAGGEDAIGDGTLTGDLDIAAGADLIFEAFDLSTGEVDTLNVTGDLTVAVADLDIDLSHLARVSVGDSWTFLTTGSQTPSVGTGPFPFTSPNPGVTFSATNDGTSITLTADVAPDKTVGIFGADRTVVEGDFSGAPVITVELRRSGDLNVTMDVDVAVSAFGGSTIDGSDFDGGVLPSGTVQFGIGEDTLTFDITLTGDDIFEGDEEFEITLSNVVTSDASASTLMQDSILVTVQDDDLAPDLQITGQVTGGGDFSFTNIDPTGSFLALDSGDPFANPATAIDITPSGLYFDAGEFIALRTVGDWDDGSGNLYGTASFALSGSNTLLAGNYLNRIQDILTPVGNYAAVSTDPTPDGTPTDIIGDFNENTLIQVPGGATHLFAMARDNFYFGDNSDVDGNFGVGAFTPLSIGVYGTGNVIATGYNFNDAAVAVGFGGGAQGDLTLRDTNWDLTVGGTVGERGGNGRLLLTDGSYITVSDPGTYGVSTDPGFNIGTDGGSGYVNIGGGSSLKVDSNFVYLGAGSNPPNTPQYTGGYDNITIGDTRGVGTLTVEGQGSLLEAYGASNRIIVGRDFGDGFVNIRDGGEVRALSLNAGRESGTGIVNVTGQGSLLHLTGATDALGNTDVYGTARYSGYSGFSTFGRSFGEGNLRISDGGTVLAENVDGVTDVTVIRFGRDYGSEGFGEIIGAGSSLNIVQTGVLDDGFSASGLRVGEGGRGELTLSQGASVNISGDTASGYIARGRDGQGASEASVLNILSGSTFTVDSGSYGLQRTYDAYGNVTSFRDAGSRFEIALNRNTNGVVNVDGAGSRLTVTSSSNVAGDYRTGDIRIGVIGTGAMNVTNGGYVAARQFEIGDFSYTINDTLYRGHGTLNINSGGTVVIDMPDNPLHVADPENNPSGYRGLRVAEFADTYGVVNIDGDGSSLTSSGGAGMMRIGRNGGEGHLNITNGGQANGFFNEFGRDGGKGYLSIDGVGSQFLADDTFGKFGYSFIGEAGFVRLGRGDDSFGRIDVTNGGELLVRNAPGSIYDLPVIELGRGIGAEGAILVEGSGIDSYGGTVASQVNITLTGASNDAFRVADGFYNGPGLHLGREGGTGDVTVRNGGEINISGEAANLRVGHTAAANGFAERSTMLIGDGGTVNVSSIGNNFGANVYVGRSTGTLGRLTVDGPSARLNVTTDNTDDVNAAGDQLRFGASVQIGRNGEGDLIVQNGGVITIDGADDAFSSFSVGAQDGGVGTALVTGAGSAVNIYGTSTDGTPLTSVYEAGIIDIGNGENSSGTLIIADGASVNNAAANSITQIGERPTSTGVIEVRDAASVLNAGTRLQIGNDLDFSTNVIESTGGDGTLTLIGGATVNVTSRIDIGTNGALNIDGTLNITQTGASDFILNEGTIFVGGDSSVGDADINASLDNGTAGVLEFELSGFGAGQFDTLELDVNLATTSIGGDDIVLDMSGLGSVNVGDTATILTFDSGAFPDLTGGTGIVNAVIQNAPPGVTFQVTQNASGDVIVEVTDAPNGSVSVEGFAQIVDEGDPGDTTQVVFTLTRNGDLTEQVTADFEIVGAGANPVDGADFDGGVLPTGTATFLANEATTTVTIDIAEDTDIEADEGFTFNLTGASSASGGVVLLNSSAPGIIRNDDSPDVISIVNAVSGLEDDFGLGNSLFFDVSRTGDLSGDVTIDFVLDANGATSGPDVNIDLLANSDDFVGGAPQLGQVTIRDGQATATIEIEIAQDTDFEPREDFTISLTGFDGDPSAYVFGNQISTGTIISDDGIPPVIPVGLEADVFGDPHLVTLDGLGYDFQAVGEFTLVEATAGAPLNVQIRTTPVEGSDLVSIISAMSADMGQGQSIMIDVTSEPNLLVNGSPTVIPATGVSPINVGDGQVFFDGSAYTIVLGTGDAFKVDVFDDFMNVCTFLDPANSTGRVLQGLLGNADGDLSNDFALRDGSPIPVDQISFDVNGTPALEFDFLYGEYADSWRITDATSLFHYSGASGDEGTADYTDTNFPVGVLTVDVLPADILADAIAAADAAGITDPVLRESAILDFALTGDDEFAAGAAGVAADPEVNTAPSSAPDLPATVGVTPVVTSIVEGNSGSQTVFFSVYRIGDTTGAFDVDYAISGDFDAADIDPTSSLTGTVSFAQGETTKTFSIDVLGDLTTEADEDIVASITAPSNILIGAPSAITTIKTDDDPPVAVDDAQTAGTANGQTIAIADLLLNDRDPNGDTVTILSVTDTTLGATVTLGATEITIDPNGIFDLLNPGETATDSFSYTVSDGNGGTDTAVVTVTVGDTVGISINDGNGNGVLNGSALSDFIDGGGGADLILAGDGDDQADGGTGGDAIAGEGGNDSLGGGFGNDILSGGDGNDTIFGGNDNDLMVGGAGVDTYFGGAGLDTVLFTDSTGGLEIDLTDPSQNSGDAAGEAFDSVERILGSTTASNTITGDAANNNFEGGSASDTLDGGGGNDQLRGNGGLDTFIGGDGDDLIFVDSADDVVIENAGEGYDRVISTVSVTLGDEVEAGNLTGGGDLDMVGNVSDNWLNGNSGDNSLSGLTGNDRLDGNAGNDTLSGGEGNDLLEGGSGVDVFMAELNGGIDRVLDFEDGTDLISLVPVDQLFSDLIIVDGAGGALITHAGGTMRLDGISASQLSAADFIEGTGSVPTVLGTNAGEALFVSNGPVNIEALGGNDLLGAFSGAATLVGGDGDDRYYVYEVGTVITELAGEGTDTVYTQVDLTLADNVENAAANGSGDIDILGNGLANFLSGNADANNLTGLGGNDRLIGGAGSDTLDGGFGNDLLEGGADADTFLFIGPHGTDRILDFQLDVDTIDFGFSPVTFDDLTITGTTDAIISSVGGVIRVDGVSAAELTEDQFQFFEIPVLE